MKEEEIKQIWKNSDTQLLPADANTLKKLRTEVDRMNSGIRRRDALEIGIAVLVVVLFGGMALLFENVYTRIGCGIIVLGAAVIIGMLRRYRKKEKDGQEAIREHVRVELAFYRKQRQLLKSVLLWYTLPIYTGLLLFFFGLTGSGTEFTGFTILNTALMIFVWYVNQRALKKEINPLINSLEQLQTNLENK